MSTPNNNPWVVGRYFILLLSISFFQTENCLSQTHVQGPTTEQVITLQKLFDSVKKTYPGMQIRWDRGILDSSGKVRVSSTMRLDSTLMQACRRLGLECTIIGNNFSIKRSKTRSLRNPVPAIRIIVTNEYNEPLPGTTIAFRSTGAMVMTTENGSIVVKPAKIQDSITITHVGMRTEKQILPKDGSIQVQMQSEQSNPMNKAIKTGYATGTKANYTGDRSTLGGSQLNFTGGVTMQTAMSGQVSGVLVTQTSGIPGSSTYLTIRGPISLVNGRDPLYVIDNVPFAPGNQSIGNISSGNAGGSLSPFSFISPSDIERIEVLKDADATAIYGSRGANGVILIFTKRSKFTKCHWDAEIERGLTGVIRRPRLLNSRQYTAMRVEAFKNDGRRFDSTNAPDLIKWDTTQSTDWGKYLLGSLSPTTNFKLAWSGGNRYMTSFVGLNGEQQTNIFPTHPDHDLINLHSNVDCHSRDRNLHVELSGILGGDWNHQPIEDPTKFQFLAPDAPALLDSAGNLVFQSKGLTFGNPLAFLRRPYTARSSEALIDGIITYQFSPSLSVSMNMGYNRVQTHEYSNIPILSQNPAFKPSASSDFAHTSYASSIFEPQVEYTRRIGNLSLHLMAGATTQFSNNTIAQASDSSYAIYDSLGNPTIVAAPPFHHVMNYRYEALFTRLNLNYRNKYVLNLTGRRDGSDRLGPYERFGNFGAIGAAWVLTHENFMKDISLISFGKLRASYGITGNDQIGDHFLQTWSPTSTGLFQNIPGYYQRSQVSLGKTWETIHKLEIALESSLWKDRLYFSLCWYRNSSSNQLLPNSLPTAGPMLAFDNWPAILENKGWEFTLQAKFIDKKDLQWIASFNWSFPISRLIAFPGLQTTPYSSFLIVGRSPFILQAYRFLGVNDSSGLFQFQTHSGNTLPNDSDKKVVGTFGIVSFGGLTNTIRWKNVALEFLIDGRFQTGNDYQSAIYTNNPPGSLRTLYSNETTDILDHWRRPGDHPRYQKFTTLPTSDAAKAINYFNSSSGILVNASFVRLRKLSLSYRLPQPLVEKCGTSEIRFFINGFNLLIITPYRGTDPELQSAQIFPTMRTVQTGVHVAF